MEFINSLSQTLPATVSGLLPGVLGALVVLIIGFLIASVLKRIVKALFKRTSIDEKISKKLSFDFSLADFIAKLAYYLVVIYTLLLVLEMMGVTSVLTPLQNMMDKFLSYLPNVIAGGIIAFAGYIIASIAAEATGFISSSLGNFSKKIGFQDASSLTKIIKQLVFIFVFIPILIVALDALKMEAISQPATEMFQTLLLSIPKIISAVLIVGIFYLVGKYVVAILVELLNNLKVDNLSKKIGLDKVIGNTSLASLIGNIVFFFLMFTGIISAAEKLEMTAINTILSDVFNIAGRVFFGLIILIAGSFIANIAGKAMENSNGLLVPIVKFGVLGIFMAFALHTMGIAESIVNLAFGLTLGSVAVAFALAFGLGGREAAGKQMEHFFNRLRNGKE